ncbi:MAG: flagellar basal body rod protein FlgC [Candidatus Lindowbacteria bacterium]|nr:flagellar basal body rod protein FlgC [Candidatus Lindowbacteria bacterium]
MSVWQAMNTAATGLSSQRTRLDVIANNIANADTTRRSDGKAGPYRKQRVIFEPRNNPIRFHLPLIKGSDIGNDPGTGVHITKVTEQDGPVPWKYMRYEPDHPDANEEGYVMYPDVDIVTEMVDMIDASRAYEASVTVMRDFRSMWSEALKIGT